MVAIIATVDPTLKPESRMDILKDQKLLGDKNADIANFSTKTERNGSAYSIGSSLAIGYDLVHHVNKEDYILLKMQSRGLHF